MISDNSTTFLAASTQLRNLFTSSSIQEYLTTRGTEWQFIPKRAPWFGGWWERLIGVMKSIIKKVLGRAFIDIFTLQTVVTEVEAVMNERPLTYITSDVGEPEPLTPSHLLYGRHITRLPYWKKPSGSSLQRTDILQRSSRMKQLVDKFRDRWRTEYLTSLRESHRKTGKNNQTIKTGDVVIVHDDTHPRSTWKLAYIKTLIHGRDGLVRSAIIKTGSGETTRPIAKLYPLEMADDLSRRECHGGARDEDDGADVDAGNGGRR